MRLAKSIPPEHLKRYHDYSVAALTDVLKGSVEKMDPKIEDLAHGRRLSISAAS
jgi:hypothetical protein